MAFASLLVSAPPERLRRPLYPPSVFRNFRPLRALRVRLACRRRIIFNSEIIRHKPRNREKSMDSIDGLSTIYIARILERASEIKRGDKVKQFPRLVAGLIFQEPSTRTYLSFVSALSRLGVKHFTLTGKQSSLNKGESMEDTIRMVRDHADLIVLRSSRPYPSQDLINAGDGNREHPTQALVDLFTIRELYTFPVREVCIIGDGKNSRAVHSFVKIIRKTEPGVQFSLVCPPPLECPAGMLSELDSTYTDIREVPLQKMDILYLVREQQERTNNGPNSSYPILTPELLKTLNPDAIILHPLPRKEELPISIDRDKRSVYFLQAKNCLPVRTAICELELSKLMILSSSNIS